MPTTRTKRTRDRAMGAGGVTEDAYEFYSAGPFFGGEDFERGKTEEELKAFWLKHRAAIMDRYMEEKRARGHAGERPAWFWSDLKEPRLYINVKLADNELWNSKAKIVEPSGREADYAYLKRLGLLEAWELEGEK